MGAAARASHIAALETYLPWEEGAQERLLGLLREGEGAIGDGEMKKPEPCLCRLCASYM